MNHLVSAENTKIEKVKSLSENLNIYYQVVSPPVPFVSDREMNILEYKKKIADDEYEVILMSIDGLPETKGKVRADMVGYWNIKQVKENTSQCKGFTQLNPHGSLPNILINKMAKGAGKQAKNDKKNIEAGTLYVEKKK